MRRFALAVVIVLALAVPALADVSVNIGINLPGPPTLVVVPSTPVYYAPSAPANVFFYNHQYWLFHGDGWYVGPSWNGPWVVVQPVYVPAPILRVPVRYYRVRPAHWKSWKHDAAPRWEGHWGRDWREASHEQEWRHREERWQHDKHDRKHKGKGGGHDDDRDRGRRGRGRGRD
jgi:hypothetical protein